MATRILHAISSLGDLSEATLDVVETRWKLLFPDGNSRDFGQADDFSARAVNATLAGQVECKDVSPLNAALQAFQTAACTIVEITPFCPVGCSTCIASSIATRVGELSHGEFERRLELLRFDKHIRLDAPLMLSGGEPTEHPAFQSLVSSPHFLNFRQRFVITNGARFADRNFAQVFASGSPGTQLYLQYDSSVREHLIQIRGCDLTDLRLATIQNCEEFGIPYTLICVVCRGVNDGIMGEIVEQNLSRPNCVGVTFQPIKFVGRNEFAKVEHRITGFDVAAKLAASLGANPMALSPHPANPLNWSIWYLDGMPPTETLLYEHNRTKRVGIVWHTDRENYVLESVAQHPVAFSEKAQMVPMEVHYGALSLGPQNLCQPE